MMRRTCHHISLNRTRLCTFRTGCRTVGASVCYGCRRAGQYWAGADADHVASLMRPLVSDAALRERISTEARRTMVEEYRAEVIGRKILARLNYVQRVFLAN